ncbi:MAG: Sua5/YciO/YrdC/YwlC family protein [Deferribacteraceae bacterium]|jgi:L-threonylcarbamoyladenylate synthase|nr:Sua5/YciO/YrdC/YwlC family protein [Deferribacteraceae bacterium]
MLVLPADFNNALLIFRLAIDEDAPVIFPTDTIYAIGAPICSISANEKIFEIKKRERNKPFPILIGEARQADGIITEGEYRWRACTTYIRNAARELSDIYKLDGRAAVRLVKNGWLGKTLRTVGALTATSVNIANNPPLIKAEDIFTAFDGIAPYMLWGESGNTPSTIIGLDGEKIR